MTKEPEKASGGRALPWILLGAAALCFAVATWASSLGKGAPQPKAASHPSPASKTAVRAPAVSRDREDLPRRPIARAEEDKPFWSSAVVPDPEHPRLPTAAGVPKRQGDPASAEHTKSQIAETEKLPAGPETTRRMNDLLIVLYNLSPADAVDWLNKTTRFAEMKPAVVSIAAAMADEGDLEAAIDSLDSLGDPTLQLSATLDIYRSQVRTGRFKRSDFAEAGFTAEEIDFIFLGD